MSSKSVELTLKIPCCEGRDLLLQLQLYRQEGIFKVNSAEFEDTNLENVCILCICVGHYSDQSAITSFQKLPHRRGFHGDEAIWTINDRPTVRN